MMRIALSIAVAAVVLAAILALMAPESSALTLETSQCDVPSGKYPTIQSAVSDDACFVVSVAEGTYSENIAIGRSVSILGQGAPTTTVDGAGAGSVFSIRSARAITLADLRIMNGHAITGGGVQVTSSTLLIRSSEVISNVATINQDYKGGGGIFSTGSNVIISDSKIIDSGAFFGGNVWNDGELAVLGSFIGASRGPFGDNETSWGGGIFNRGGHVQIISSEIISNRARHSPAIYSWSGTVLISDTLVSQNEGEETIMNAGGSMSIRNSLIDHNDEGVRSGGGSLEVSSSTISNNSSFDDTGDGGAIKVSESTLTVTNSLLSNNAGYLGGGILAEDSLVLVLSSTVSHNSSGAEFGMGTGGGIASIDSDMTIQNSTVSGNTVASGSAGGIYHGSFEPHLMTIINSTVTGNSADQVGGGIQNWAHLQISSSTIGDNSASAAASIYNGDTLTLTHTIVAGSGPGNDCFGTIASDGYNLIGDTAGCTFTSSTGDLINTDPKIDPVQDNGGSTATQALRFDSPAVNAGNPAGCTDYAGTPLLSDQRGMPRFERCDIGAYELQPLGFSTKSVTPEIIRPFAPVSYTIILRNGGDLDLPALQVTDTLPISLTYRSGSLISSSGAFDYSDGVVSWTGSVAAGENVTITFGASTTVLTGLVNNTALITGGGEEFRREALVEIDPFRTYISCIVRDY